MNVFGLAASHSGRCLCPVVATMNSGLATWIGAAVTTLLAVAIGAWLGWLLWPACVGLAIAALDARSSGFPWILGTFCEHVGVVLGSATGLTLVVVGGRWRRIGGAALGVTALATLAWVAPIAWRFMQCEGRRLALAVYGLPMLWFVVLSALGLRMAMQRQASRVGAVFVGERVDAQRSIE